MMRKYKTKEQGGRYGDHPPRTRRWTPNEDHILRAVVFSCNSDNDLVRASKFLCTILDREPTFGKKARPTAEKFTMACYDLIKDRLHNMIMAYRNYTPDVIYEGFCRDHLLPLPWIDKRMLLMVKFSTQAPPPMQHVAAVLGRKDVGPLEQFMKSQRSFVLEPFTGKRFKPTPNLEIKIYNFKELTFQTSEKETIELHWKALLKEL